MRKIWLVIAAIAVISCKQEAPVDYAIVSGTILNSSATALSIQSVDGSFSAKTSIENGTFLDTLKIENGVHHISDGKNNIRIYLSTGSNIVVNYDATNPMASVSFTGTGSEVSTYLQNRFMKTAELKVNEEVFYSLKEAAFKAKCQEIAATVKGMLDDEGIDAAFRAEQSKHIHYEYLFELSLYEMYHRYYSKNPNFKVSEDFLAELNEIAMDNEEEFKNLGMYREVVKIHFRIKASEIVKAEGIAGDIAFIKAVATSPSETIKNAILSQTAASRITYTEDIEVFYKTYMEACTDEEMRTSMTKTYNTIRSLAKGQPSPNFEDYENYAGGTTSLADLKGKFVYIDVWATWCGPCKAEIPSLKKVEKKYHGKNIEFVSISVDNERAHGAWKKMVKEMELGGIQLFADKSFKSDFIQGYVIKGIPRFILIDPEGNIVSSNAPRPSDPTLIDMFNANSI